MTKLPAAFLLIVLSATFAEAQVLAVNWQNDPALKTWPDRLPPGWVIKPDRNTLRIERSEPIWLLLENKINAPLGRETDRERSRRIRQFGQPATAFVSFSLTPKSGVKELWSRVSLPQYLSPLFEIDLIDSKGFEDDFHSVDPPVAVQELAAVRKTLVSKLQAVLTPDKHLWDYEGQKVVLIGVKSTAIWQHVMNYDPGFPYSEYIDWKDAQTVAYSAKPLPGTGPWELSATVFALGGDNKDPDVKDSVREYHLRVESFRTW